MTQFEKVYQTLIDYYGAQGWWPLFDRAKDPLICSYTHENTIKSKTKEEMFEICVGAILTQNTNWSNAQKALSSLIKSDYLNPITISEANIETISDFIKSSGYYNQKAKKLIGFSTFFINNPEPDRQLFLKQWGLGPETVDDMLLYAFDQPVFVVDLYTRRFFSRLGLCSETIEYHELQALISKNIEKDVTIYKEYHALIVRHAKEFCKKTPDCINCNVIDDCIYNISKLN